MTRRRLQAGSIGCTGCLGMLSGLAGLGMLGLLGVSIAGYLVQQQWESAVRRTLAKTTGSEADFGSLGLGFGRVTIYDLELHDGTGSPLLTVADASVYASPFDLLGPPSAWQLQRLSFDGVRLTPHRTDDGFALPTATLELLRGEGAVKLADLPLPPLKAPDVVLTDVVAILDGHELGADTLRLPSGGHLALDPVSLHIGDVVAEGVTLGEPATRVAEARFALPDALDLDTLNIPLQSPQLSGIRVHLDGVDATVDAAHAQADVVASIDGEPSLQVGSWAATGFRIDAANVITGREATLRVDEPLTVQHEEVVVDELTLTGLRSAAGPSGWPAIGRILTATDGVRLPRVQAPKVVIEDTVLSVAGAAASARTTRTGLTLVPGERLDWSAGQVEGLTLRVGNEPRVTAATVAIPADGVGPAGKLTLDQLHLTDVAATLQWGAHGFGIPEEVYRLASVQGGMDVQTVRVDGLALSITSASGTLPVSATSAQLDGVAVTPDGLDLGGGSVRSLRADDGQLRATIDRLTLGAGGVVDVGAAQVWTRIGANRHLSLPPVAAQHAPGWIGGSYPGEGPFFGVAFPGSPYMPTQLRAPKVVVHVVDDAIASESTTWDVPVAITLGPHDASGHLPVAVTGTFVGGELAMAGSLKPSNALHASVEARGLLLGDLGMYLDAPLSKWGLTIEQGRADSDLTVDLAGSQVTLDGHGTGVNLKMGGSALAGVANTGFDVIKGSDSGVRVPIRIAGDLSDPDFSPMDLLIASYTQGIRGAVDLSGLKDVGNSVKKLVGNVTGKTDDGAERADGGAAGEQVDDAMENVRGALRDVFGKKKKKSK